MRGFRKRKRRKQGPLKHIREMGTCRGGMTKDRVEVLTEAQELDLGGARHKDNTSHQDSGDHRGTSNLRGRNLLDCGKLQANTPTSSILRQYLQSATTVMEQDICWIVV